MQEASCGYLEEKEASCPTSLLPQPQYTYCFTSPDCQCLPPAPTGTPYHTACLLDLQIPTMLASCTTMYPLLASLYLRLTLLASFIPDTHCFTSSTYRYTLHSYPDAPPADADTYCFPPAPSDLPNAPPACIKHLQILTACLLHLQIPTASLLHLHKRTACLLSLQIPTACFLHLQIFTACRYQMLASCTSRLHLSHPLHLKIPTLFLMQLCLPHASPDTDRLIPV